MQLKCIKQVYETRKKFKAHNSQFHGTASLTEVEKEMTMWMSCPFNAYLLRISTFKKTCYFLLLASNIIFQQLGTSKEDIKLNGWKALSFPETLALQEIHTKRSRSRTARTFNIFHINQGTKESIWDVHFKNKCLS